MTMPQRLLSVFLAFILVASFALYAAGCGGEATDGSTFENVPVEPPYESPYTWSNLVYEEGRFYYYKDEVLVSRIGIDVSSHQKVIDWYAVAADGIEFAFIRVGNRGATEGQMYLDEQFHANIAGAKEAGIAVGVYFFSQAITAEEALEEAEFVLAYLGGIELEYPVVYDHEPVTIEGTPGRANSLTVEQATAQAEAFCTRIKEAGYAAMLYGNKKDIARYDSSLVENSDVWFAEYDASLPSGQFDFIMWQYSSTGSVAGISVPVDMNIHFLEP